MILLTDPGTFAYVVVVVQRPSLTAIGQFRSRMHGGCRGLRALRRIEGRDRPMPFADRTRKEDRREPFNDAHWTVVFAVGDPRTSARDALQSGTRE